MEETILKSLPLLAVFMAGVVMRYVRLVPYSFGLAVLKFVYYFGMPIIIISTIYTLEFSWSLAILMLLVPTVMTITIVCTLLLRKTLLNHLHTKTFATILIGAPIMNTGFLIPFVYQYYGSDGIATLIIIDAVNALLVFSAIHMIAMTFGQRTVNNGVILKKLIVSPPLLAIFFALLLKFSNITIHSGTLHIMSLFITVVGVLILLSLGILFEPRSKKIRLLPYPILLRMGLGLCIGLLFVTVSGLNNVSAHVVLLASMAPIGFNSLVFSSLEKLDVQFAAMQVSFSIIIAFIVIPIFTILTANIALIF